MNRYLFLTAITFLFSLTLAAQNLYRPRDVSHAYKNGTRAEDGRPGRNYWQNTGNYNISITVTPPNRVVKGSEQITYFNNSPDTLRSLNIKLIMNVHRAGATRFRSTDVDYITDGMQVDALDIAGVKQAWDNKEARETNQEVKLPSALLPHSSVSITITWHYQLALAPGREGVITPTTFYLGYFYPRVSVYDDYNGWDKLDFNDRQEFYNDFNDYTLNVTVPKNFIVWATGTLQNPKEVLQQPFIGRLNASLLTDSVLHIATAADVAAKNITTQNEMNTWVWKASHISDMAVGLSDTYVWDAASTVVDDATKRRASMQAAFPDSAVDFHSAVKFGVHTLNWFSHNLPGVPYPFPKMTAFQGFADMEFPMMVNDERDADIADAELLQDHEMAHTYFPFYMGINETRYGYMDEGWATTFELFINEVEVGKEKARKNYKNSRVKRWITDPSSSEDLPLITPTSELVGGYAHNAYGKASLSYLALKDLLGDGMFKKALHFYMATWNGKHPIPWDYFNCINTATGKNLNWFFNNWFYTNGYSDLALQSVVKSPRGYTLAIKNVGGFAIPFDVKLTYTDGATASFHQTPAVWQYNQANLSVNIATGKTIRSAELDNGLFMDADLSNNKWVAK